MSIEELRERKKQTHRNDRETHTDLWVAIGTQKYNISQRYDELAEIERQFERLNMEAAERRARKARRQE